MKNNQNGGVRKNKTLPVSKKEVPQKKIPEIIDSQDNNQNVNFSNNLIEPDSIYKFSDLYF